MPRANQLRRDLEAFLEDFYFDTYSAELSLKRSFRDSDSSSRKKLVESSVEQRIKEKLIPQVENFFDYYKTPLYNQERINHIKDNLIKNLPEYVKINSEFKLIYSAHQLASNFLSLLMGGVCLLSGKYLTGYWAVGGANFFVGYFLSKLIQIPVTKECLELKQAKERKIEEILG